MSEPRVSRRPPLLVALATFLFLECALLAAAASYLVIELLIAVPASYATAIAVLILVLLAAIWLAVMAVHTLRGRYWIRGAAVTWQALQIAIGIGSFQGLFARPDVGWLLIIPAVIVIVLLFTPPVLEATKRREG
ncbi:MAG: hypothetical protein JWM49_3056 [Microbacteriaceae bacterium]|jgi:hypothetical protein|nr:hypothetical protein [Microbacteriaceae bacterium]